MTAPRLCADQPLRRCLRFLRMGPIRRTASGWHFGTASIADTVIARALADGLAVRDGDTVTLAAPKPAANATPLSQAAE